MPGREGISPLGLEGVLPACTFVIVHYFEDAKTRVWCESRPRKEREQLGRVFGMFVLLCMGLELQPAAANGLPSQLLSIEGMIREKKYERERLREW